MRVRSTRTSTADQCVRAPTEVMQRCVHAHHWHVWALAPRAGHWRPGFQARTPRVRAGAPARAGSPQAAANSPGPDVSGGSQAANEPKALRASSTARRRYIHDRPVKPVTTAGGGASIAQAKATRTGGHTATTKHSDHPSDQTVNKMCGT